MTDAISWHGQTLQKKTTRQPIGTPYGAGTNAAVMAMWLLISASLTFPRSTQKPAAKDAGLLGYRRCQPRPEDAELADVLDEWEARTPLPYSELHARQRAGRSKHG